MPVGSSNGCTSISRYKILAYSIPETIHHPKVELRIYIPRFCLGLGFSERLVFCFNLRLGLGRRFRRFGCVGASLIEYRLFGWLLATPHQRHHSHH